MVPDLDVFRAAQAVIKSFGGDAELHAAQRADELMAAGDMDGRRTWRRIEDAIRVLRKTAPDADEAVH